MLTKMNPRHVSTASRGQRAPCRVEALVAAHLRRADEDAAAVVGPAVVRADEPRARTGRDPPRRSCRDAGTRPTWRRSRSARAHDQQRFAGDAQREVVAGAGYLPESSDADPLAVPDRLRARSGRTPRTCRPRAEEARGERIGDRGFERRQRDRDSSSLIYRLRVEGSAYATDAIAAGSGQSPCEPRPRRSRRTCRPAASVRASARSSRARADPRARARGHRQRRTAWSCAVHRRTDEYQTASRSRLDRRCSACRAATGSAPAGTARSSRGGNFPRDLCP